MKMSRTRCFASEEIGSNWMELDRIKSNRIRTDRVLKLFQNFEKFQDSREY